MALFDTLRAIDARKEQDEKFVLETPLRQKRLLKAVASLRFDFVEVLREASAAGLLLIDDTPTSVDTAAFGSFRVIVTRFTAYDVVVELRPAYRLLPDFAASAILKRVTPGKERSIDIFFTSKPDKIMGWQFRSDDVADACHGKRLFEVGQDFVPADAPTISMVLERLFED